MFCSRLKKAMSIKCMNQQQLSEATGLTKSGISQYLSGNNLPTAKNLEKLAEALEVPAEWLKNGDSKGITSKIAGAPTKLSPAQAAKLMGVGAEFVRVGLQKGTLPFGYAVKIKAKRFTYYISSAKFTEFTGIEVPPQEEAPSEQENECEQITASLLPSPLVAASR